MSKEWYTTKNFPLEKGQVWNGFGTIKYIGVEHVILHNGEAEASIKIQELRKAIHLSREDIFRANRQDIAYFLQLEISSKVFGTQRGVEIGIQNDPVVRNAVEIINDQQAYASILP